MLTEDIKAFERQHRKFDISLEKWKEKKPHGISGMFRLRNEEQFMRAAVVSHLPWLDQVVLVVQPSDDQTEEIAKGLHAEFRDKVKLAHYPFPVHGVGTTGHALASENSVYGMVHMTNWGISQCDYSWVAKIEGDVIALSTFQAIRDAVDATPDIFIHYGRVGLNIAGEKYDKISFTNPRNAGWDESVFNNHPTFHCVKADKFESINLHEDRSLLRNMGWSFLHTKRCKAGAKENIERWTLRTPENIQRALLEYNSVHPYPGIDEEALGIPALFERTVLDD